MGPVYDRWLCCVSFHRPALESGHSKGTRTIHRYARMYMCLYMCACIHVLLCIYECVHTRTRSHVHTRTHTHQHSSPPSYILPVCHRIQCPGRPLWPGRCRPTGKKWPQWLSLRKRKYLPFCSYFRNLPFLVKTTGRMIYFHFYAFDNLACFQGSFYSRRCYCSYSLSSSTCRLLLA